MKITPSTRDEWRRIYIDRNHMERNRETVLSMNVGSISSVLFEWNWVSVMLFRFLVKVDLKKNANFFLNIPLHAFFFNSIGKKEVVNL